jgi:hypothetical protein
MAKANGIRGKAAIAGVGCTEFSKHAGRTGCGFACESITPRWPAQGSRPPTSTDW